MRQILLLDLVDDADAIARYEAWHAAGAVPAAVIASIRASGILDMEIWRRGVRLVMVIEVGPTFSADAKQAADAADPDVQAWERLMDTMQHPLADAAPGEKWSQAARIFALTEQVS